MRLVDLLVRYTWPNPACYLPLLTTCANEGIVTIEDGYLTTKLLRGMGCEL